MSTQTASRKVPTIMSATILAEFSRLSTPEQLQLVDELWDLIFAKGDDLALTAPQRAMLDREHE